MSTGNGSAAAPSPRITELRLRNWRNFTRVRVALQTRAFIMGPNASGKSNLLDSLRFLNDIVAVGGGFQEAVQVRGGISRIRSLAARRDPNVEVFVAVGTDTGEEPGPEWTYHLIFGQDPQHRPTVKAETVTHRGVELISRPDDQDRADRARLSQTALEQVNVNRDFRPLADFLKEIRYLHIVPQLVREPDRSVGKKNDPFGGDFLEQVARTSQREREKRLRRIRVALQVAVPQLKTLRLDRDEVSGTPHLVGVYEHWRQHGARQDETQFSDGTLRLLGLLWAVLDGTGPLLLEEPELSLHSAVVRGIPGLFANVQRSTAGRQILVSTHSEDLLLDPGVGLDEVLVLEPGQEGTSVRLASDFPEVEAMVEGGVSLSDVLGPRTAPRGAEQLALFG